MSQSEEESNTTKEDIENQLFEACEKGDINALKVLLEPPYSVDTIVCNFLYFDLNLKITFIYY